MSDNAGDRTPKTLAEVSHLFFSKAEDREDADTAEHRGSRGTRYFVVTGDGGRPGKSTVAVNLASAFLTRGRAALIDADPRIPNARFFLGFPSWHYLSPVTGNGTPAPNLAIDSGLVVIDHASRGADLDPAAWGETLSVEIEGLGSREADYAVLDVPIHRISLCRPVAERGAEFLVVGRPGWDGFAGTIGTLSVLGGTLGVERAGVVVNGAPDAAYATAFHTKINDAARRLLSMETRLMGGIVFEPDLGSEQRERGAIVHSRPAALSALSLRDVASNALRLCESETGGGNAAVPGSQLE